MHVDDKISFNPFPGLSLKTFPVLVLLFVTNTQEAFSQLYDDFSDGDATANPTWSGTTDHFRVNEALQLQLNASAAGESWLSVHFESNPSELLEWEFLIGQSFAPSGSNFGRFYLVSDQPDLSAPLNGYFLQFGEPGSADAVELFHQLGTATTPICRARDGAIAGTFRIRIKVIYSPPGKWEVRIDYSGGDDYTLDATGSHLNSVSGLYSGVFCRYTVSNATRFYFDDIGMDAVKLPETRLPRIDSVEVMSSRSLKVFFSEPLDATSVVSDNFDVTPYPGTPIATTLDFGKNVVTLLFEGSFANGEQSVLHARGIRDVSGNQLSSEEISFLFFEETPVAWKDIIITEIFPDPLPSVGLPDAEFVELYNRGSNPVNLSGWVLADLSTSVELPFYILLPQRYLILTGPYAADQFGAFGNVLSLPRFPSLNNAGDGIFLTDGQGVAIDSARYSLALYRDEDKAEGGWTIELIDPEDRCRNQENWTAAEIPVGGTPGQKNSVYASRPDNTGPGIISAIPLNPTTLAISFDEKLKATLPAAQEFLLDPGPQILSLQFADHSLTKLMLTLASPLSHGEKYLLTIESVFDCAGNRIRPDGAQTSFLLPEKARPGDVIVNEVLFNPRPTGVDFIEIHNQSAKVIDVQHWSVRNMLSASDDAVDLTADHFLIHPGQYLVFTENPDVLKGEYVMGVRDAFFEKDIPPLNDDEGSVTLLDESGSIIDTIYYADRLHSVFVQDDEGISLERISGTASGTESSNWRSGSSTSGFATPGYVNSNTRIDRIMADGVVAVEPEIIRQQITPHDFARINYQFTQGGLIGNIRIVDRQGRTIRTIASNELLGTQGFFRWDADSDDGAMATTGYYMVWFEVFDATGEVRTFRKRVAVF